MVGCWVAELVEKMVALSVDYLVGLMGETMAETMVVKTALKKVHRLVDVMVEMKGF